MGQKWPEDGLYGQKKYAIGRKGPIECRGVQYGAEVANSPYMSIEDFTFFPCHKQMVRRPN